MKKSLQLVGFQLTIGLCQAIVMGPTLLAPVLAQDEGERGGIEALDDPAYWQDLCHSQVEASLFDEAQMSCEQAIALAPDNEIAWSNYSNLLLTLEQYPKALSAAGQLLTQNDQNSQAMTYQCLAYLGLNQLEPALDACNNALLTNSFWGEMSPVLPLQSRGQILNQMDQPNQALIAYGQALQIEPNNALTLAYRCQTLVSLEQYDYAEAACKDAIEDDEQLPREDSPALAFATLGDIHTYRGNRSLTLYGINTVATAHYDEAIEHYDKAIALAPENAPYYLQQGWLFEQTNDLAAAALSYTQYVTLVPESSQGLTAQCSLFNKQAQYDLAKAACEQAIAGNGDWLAQVDSAEAWRGLAQATASLGDYEAALPIVERALDIDGNLLAAKSDRVVILWYLAQYDDAIKKAEELLATDPPTAQNRSIIANTWATLGRLYSHKGDTENSIKAYQNALVLDDENAETHANFSAVLFKSGFYEDAIIIAKEATRLNPLLLQGWQNLAVAQEKIGDSVGARTSRDRLEQLEQAQS